MFLDCSCLADSEDTEKVCSRESRGRGLGSRDVLIWDDRVCESARPRCYRREVIAPTCILIERTGLLPGNGNEPHGCGGCEVINQRRRISAGMSGGIGERGRDGTEIDGKTEEPIGIQVRRIGVFRAGCDVVIQDRIRSRTRIRRTAHLHPVEVLLSARRREDGVRTVS